MLKHAIEGARQGGAVIKEFVLRDYKISPCLEIYGCKHNGQCVINDDFHKIKDAILAADGLMIASPIFFYTVSAHTKIFMDRCQSLWVKKYWMDNQPDHLKNDRKKALFISVGATRGKKLFDGTLLTMKYFLDVLDMELWKTLLYRGLDFEGDVYQRPEYLDQAHSAGRQLAAILKQ